MKRTLLAVLAGARRMPHCPPVQTTAVQRLVPSSAPATASLPEAVRV